MKRLSETSANTGFIILGVSSRPLKKPSAEGNTGVNVTGGLLAKFPNSLVQTVSAEPANAVDDTS